MRLRPLGRVIVLLSLLGRIQNFQTPTRGFGDDVRVVVLEDIVDRRMVVLVAHAVLNQGEERLERSREDRHLASMAMCTPSLVRVLDQ